MTKYIAVARCVRRLVCLVLLSAGTCAAQDMTKVQPFWWPDPNTGLMWTGYPVGGISLHFAEAEKACSLLTLDGYTGWRLPSRKEFEQASETIRLDDPSAPYGVRDGQALKFGSEGWYWTSTVGNVPGDHWAMLYPDRPGSKNAGTSFHYTAMCVRSMEPDLVAMAKAVHPDGPVSGVAALQAIGLLEKSEAATNALQFVEAIAEVKQALALYPVTVQAYDDLALNYEYLGRWDDALASLRTADKADKNGRARNPDRARIAKLKKEAATDANVTAAHVLVLKASVALTNAKFQDAIDASNDLIKLEPKWGEGYQYLGQTYVRMKRWDDAAIALKTASELDKDIKGQVSSDLKWAQNQQKSEKKS